MLFRNIIIASRFLLKHKEYTAINIFGLTLSLACALFIGLYIYDELSFDRFHTNAGRIFRVVENKVAEDGTTTRLGEVAFRVSSLPEQLPAIEKAAKVTFFGRTNISTDENENKSYEPFVLAEPSFLEIFDFKVLHGTRDRALSESHSVMITRSTAERLFGKTDVVNKVIRTASEDDGPYRITAVLEDFPDNSHFTANMIFSLESFASEDWYKKSQAGDWESSGFSTYFLLKEGTDAPALEKTITEIVQKNRKEKTSSTFALQPLTEIHFHSGDIRGGFLNNPGEIHYLYIFGAVGIFILIISCINYINLSTSLSISRGKEVGVKKVAGAARHNLIYQFITESNLVSAAAVILALLMVSALMPAFNIFIGKSLTTALLWDVRVLLILAGFTLLIGTLSGSYPAFYLSRFKPAIAIKGFSSGSKKTGTIRQGLVIFQFALSIMLILATLVAQEQISFIRHKDLGFRQDQLVVLDINSGGVRKGFETIKNEIARIPLVTSVSVSSRVPGEWKNLPQVDVSLSGREEQQKLYFIGIDDAFVKTFDIELISGRNFSGDPSDSASFIINETAARQMGFADPLTETLSVESVNYAISESKLEKPFKGKIIGIVKDFHFQSLHQKIGPLLFACHNNPVHNIDYFSVRLNPGDWQTTLKDMEKALQMVDPGHQIEYNFLDERLADFYRQDIKRGQFFTLAAGISITLACLGLFSLASFMTEQRTKEIGIRKALGATSRQIVMMLSTNYIKLVFAGFLVATPLAIWLLNQWLQSFAYRIEIGWVSIAVACIASLLVALLTVGYKSLSAAAENPVNSLRSE